MILLDTNVILRFILQDHPIYALKSEKIFKKIDNGEIKVYISWIVIFETVFVMQNTHKLSKDEIQGKLIPILNLENVKIEQENLIKSTFDYFIKKNISLADAYHVALMNKRKINQIYSFDKDFDKFPDIKRLVN